MTFRRRAGLILVGFIVVLAFPALPKLVLALRLTTYRTETYTSVNLRKSSSLRIVVPKIDEVHSLRIVFGAPWPKEPNPLSANTPRSRAIIMKLLDWLKQSKPIGYETKHTIIRTIPPPVAEIRLMDGRQLVLQPAVNSIIHFRNGQVRTETGYYAKNDIDFVSGNQTIRIYSPGLYRWVSLGEWVKDIPWPPRAKR